jgi:hypothetical protein
MRRRNMPELAKRGKRGSLMHAYFSHSGGSWGRGTPGTDGSDARPAPGLAPKKCAPTSRSIELTGAAVFPFE